MAHLSSILKRPLRALCIDRSTPLPHTPSEYTDLPFHPLLLINPSPPTTPTSARQSWTHVQGAGDDEANWSRGLTPSLFWLHADELLSLTPLDCEQRVDELVAAHRAREGGEVDAHTSVVPHALGETGLLVAYSTSAPLTVEADGPARLHLAVVQDRVKAGELNRDRRAGGSSPLPAPSSSSAVPSALTLPVSGVMKDKRALQDILAPSLRFIAHHRSLGRSVFITGDDWTAVTAVAAGAVVSGCNEKYEWVGEEGEGVMRHVASKQLIRVTSNFVLSHLPDVFSTRLQLKQLNLFFLSLSSS